MDITTAQALLQSTINTKTDELAVLQLALSILNSTYQAEFTTRDTAVAEANDFSQKLNEEKAKTIALNATVNALEATVADKEAQVATLTANVNTVPAVRENMI